MTFIKSSSDLRNNYPEISSGCKKAGPEYFLAEKLNEAAADVGCGRIYPAKEVFDELRIENEKLLEESNSI